MWRVLENLLGNVSKYAMPGSRVYIQLEQASDDKVSLTLKNMSKNPLNISEQELMERFVRGDESRSTDGSGLGLSIARDLIRLMKGDLLVQLDGDLFKVTIQMPRMEQESTGAGKELAEEVAESSPLEAQEAAFHREPDPKADLKADPKAENELPTEGEPKPEEEADTKE